MESPHEPFSLLADELLFHIFGFLTIPALGSCMRVCKAWSAAATDELFVRIPFASLSLSLSRR